MSAFDHLVAATIMLVCLAILFRQGGGGDPPAAA